MDMGQENENRMTAVLMTLMHYIQKGRATDIHYIKIEFTVEKINS